MSLFIVKRITENMQISDEAFVVWCALRSIMEKDETEYFVNHNVLAWRIFNRTGNRTELETIKAGFNELVNLGYVKILFNCNKSDHVVDLSALYYNRDEFFATITLEEMHKIMNIEGRHDKYKLLRYFTCQIGSFNQSDSMMDYKGKIGSLSLEYFESLMPINKSTVISFNRILEENHILFIIRHKDFYQTKYSDGSSNLREIPNTYSRWCDRKLAEQFAENLHGYEYMEYKKNVQTDEANHRRSLGQKLHYYMDYNVEYSDEELQELREYAAAKNSYMEREYKEEIARGNHPPVPDYIDMDIFCVAS